jgi:8-amino-7-oxononanoate synthase
MSDKFGLQEELSQLFAKEKAKQLFNTNRKVNYLVEYRGKSLIDFTAKDLFCYSSNPKVLKSIQQDLERNGLSSLSSRFCSGNYAHYHTIEHKLAELTRQSASLVFSSKNQAILTLISSVLDERDALILSEDLSGPYADSAFLAQVDTYTFKPFDPASLRNALERTVFKRRKLVVIDSISNLDGELKDIPAIIQICSEYNSNLVVDESFSFGLIGTTGAGVADHFKLIELPFAKILDFSAILGNFGASIVGSKELIALLLARSNVLANEVPISPALISGLDTSIALMELSLIEREKLQALKNNLVSGINDLKIFSHLSPAIPIVSLRFKSMRLANEFREALIDKGFLTELNITTKSRNEQSYITFYLNTAHTQKHISDALEAISVIANRIS